MLRVVWFYYFYIGINFECMSAENGSFVHSAPRILQVVREMPELERVSTLYIPQGFKTPNQYLGRSFDAIVFEAHADFYLNTLTALMGTLKAGGTFYFVLPEVESWANENRLNARLYAAIQQWPYYAKPFSASERRWSNWGEHQVTPDQLNVIQAVMDSQTPVLIQADRGRGKSSALGLACQALAELRVGLTAPNKAAVQEVMQWSDGHQPEFYAPDQLLQSLPELDVLLVDEAAAIPIPLLKKMVQAYPRIVFSTTVHGYEGSGRGFAVRFKAWLEESGLNPKVCHLNQPIRWAQNDPLERWMNETFLMDVELNSVPSDVGLMNLSCAELSQDELAQNEALLSQVFGLLMQAHYRTTPEDLRGLLDDEARRLFVLKHQEHIIGVCSVIEEGGMSRELQQAVLDGTRRPKGQMLPNILLSEGYEWVGDARYWRISRIAVHENVRKQGLGTELMNHVIQEGLKQGLQIGVSFADDVNVRSFWQSLGFETVRVGHKRDARSGLVSRVMLYNATQIQEPS